MTSLLSSGLLAASMLVGQAGDASKSAPAPLPQGIQQTQGQTGPQVIQSSPGQPQSRPGFGWFGREDRPIITRIQSWWKRDQRDVPVSNSKTIRETAPPPITTAPAPIATPAPSTTTPADFPRKMPNPQSQNVRPTANSAKKTTEPTDVQQTTLNNLALHKVAKYPIHAVNTGRIGRDEKFEWITGQIEMENGNAILYYATPETVDKYNGRVVLLPQKNELSEFKSGDLISVRGTISHQKTMQGIVPIYRVNEATMIERVKS
jgi:hypothetical protein